MDQKKQLDHLNDMRGDHEAFIPSMAKKFEKPSEMKILPKKILETCKKDHHLKLNFKKYEDFVSIADTVYFYSRHGIDCSIAPDGEVIISRQCFSIRNKGPSEDVKNKIKDMIGKIKEVDDGIYYLLEDPIACNVLSHTDKDLLIVRFQSMIEEVSQVLWEAANYKVSRGPKQFPIWIMNVLERCEKFWQQEFPNEQAKLEFVSEEKKGTYACNNFSKWFSAIMKVSAGVGEDTCSQIAAAYERHRKVKSKRR